MEDNAEYGKIVSDTLFKVNLTADAVKRHIKYENETIHNIENEKTMTIKITDGSPSKIETSGKLTIFTEDAVYSLRPQHLAEALKLFIEKYPPFVENAALFNGNKNEPKIPMYSIG